MTYGKINYHTIYTNDIQNSSIVSYQDSKPRSYYQPYSETNPDGYPPQTMGITNPRETELLVRVMRYVDSLHLIDNDVNLDGNNDGMIDNISFIIKGNVGNWNDLLWPHMNFFGTEAYQLSINGKIPSAYNFEFANSGPYFTANVFSHEMGHSLGIPDYYHYYHYNNVTPVGLWDQMAQNNLQQVSTIIKYKFLGIVDEPAEITVDGHYVLNSNSSSDHQNCYFIRSAIDPNQWFTLEFRNCDDFMENERYTEKFIKQ
jgi:M6 family metalloprotease-like protein